MADDPIRAFLRSLPQADLVRKPPGTVAISRSAISDGAEDGGPEVEAVMEWMAEHGGRIVRPPPTQSQGSRSGRRVARTMPGDVYYLIPARALTDRSE